MANVRLEFENLLIKRLKERWKLYFVICTEHPTESDKMLVGVIPQTGIIKMKPQQDNKISFVPEGGDDGMIILERVMPNDRTIKVHTYLRHTRQSTRDLGKVLQNIEKELGTDVFGVVQGLLGVANPWLVVAEKAIHLIGGILQRIPDRDFGFVNMDCVFESDFESQTEKDMSNNFSTGEAGIVWSWSVVD